jgi:hypothetical protein
MSYRRITPRSGVLLYKLTVAQLVKKFSPVMELYISVHHHVQKSPPPISIRNHMNQIHSLQSCSLKIYFNNILLVFRLLYFLQDF